MIAHTHVLVADDDPDMLGAVSDALMAMGADVVKAESGAELIQRMADSGPFGLIVTDISMPWMSGLQAMHSARTAGIETAVLVMTGLRGERIPAQVQALGPKAALLRKPFQVGELESAAEKLLSQ